MLFSDFFLLATKFRPFHYQIELGETPLETRVLRVPTGGGKTEAAILPWLFKTVTDPANTPKRLVIFMPMRALVTQTVGRIQEWVKNLSLSSDQVAVVELLGEHPELRARNREWTENPERPTILVGTVDLLLSAALNRGYAMSRFRWPVAFGLLHNSALWVIDEVQLMGPATATFAQLEQFRSSFGTVSPVFTWWMSATVESEWLATVDFQNPPPVKPRDWNQLIQDLGIKYSAKKPLREAKLLDAALVHESHQGRLTLAIVNTVKAARDLFRALEVAPPAKNKKKKAEQPALNQPALFLIHSRFRPVDRKARIDSLLDVDQALRFDSVRASDYPNGAIVIATQVAEAGLDVSAQTMISELAPWSSMVQRFGRLNRTGQEEQARGVWVDVKTPAPYPVEELKSSLERLKGLSDAGPASLALISLPAKERESSVIRRHDLLGLFSTNKDLAGGFTDVSDYIRDSEERDVYVGWRDFKGSPNTLPPEDEMETFELCSVPISEAKEFRQKGNSLWEWNDEVGKWEPRYAQDLVPGMTLLTALSSGGYSPLLGWTGVEQDRPTVAARPAALQQDSNRTDESSVSGWRELALHLSDVEAEAAAIATSIALDAYMAQALLLAARWHDIGKSLPAWQQAVKQAVQKSGGVYMSGTWAKFPARRGMFRPGLRHEEASALYAMQLLASGEPGWSALAIYLIACHHGKVRTTIGTFGVKSLRELKDCRVQLPGFVDQPTEVICEPLAFCGAGRYEPDSAQMVITGESWTSLVASLTGSDQKELADKGTLGPFRLAFLEALIVASDIRASRKYGVGDA